MDRSILLRKAHYVPVGVVIVLLLVAALGWLGVALGSLPTWMTALVDTLSILTAIFLGIFIEAMPYLLLGTLASALVEVFFKREELMALFPRQPLAGALAGSLMGLFFPVCECGVVPFTRRLFQKGLPVPMGVSFLLAAPVLNPIVIASTLAAFGAGVVFWGRMGLTLVIAVSTGLIFALYPRREALLRPLPLVQAGWKVEAENTTDAPPLPPTSSTLTAKLQRMLVIAGEEFFEMGRYLILGALLASLLQTLLPQSAMLGLGQGALLSVLVLIALAVLLSVCSTVDAFIALSFAGSFTTGSVLAFLVFGAMVDIKSTMMFLRVFDKRTVVYLILLPLMMTIVATVALNTFTGL